MPVREEVRKLAPGASSKLKQFLFTKGSQRFAIPDRDVRVGQEHDVDREILYQGPDFVTAAGPQNAYRRFQLKAPVGV